MGTELGVGVWASIIAVIIIAWTYDFFNGMNDAANTVATSICTGALRPRAAVIMGALLNFAGAYYTTEVAKTIGKGIVDPHFITLELLCAGLIGAAMWSWWCTRRGMPISITHSVIGGFMGPAVVAHGFGVLQRDIIMKKVLLAMIFSPVAGFFGGLVLMIFVTWLAQAAMKIGARYGRQLRVSKFFRTAQLGSAAYMGFSHGANDAQNAMGAITAALVATGFVSATEWEVPKWVIFGSAFFMGLGTYLGGWKVIRTLGMRLVKLQPVQGFSAETTAATVMLLASRIGAPISTTHAISTAVMGAGAVRRLSAVKWGVATNIMVAWFLTIPGAAAIGIVTHWAILGVSGKPLTTTAWTILAGIGTAAGVTAYKRSRNKLNRA